jgi:hypothetical protein
MEYLYSSYTKLIDDNIYFFVKKTMTFPEFMGVPDVLIGYGMHTDFEKACSICGVDKNCRKQLLVEMEQRRLSMIPQWLPIIQAPVQRKIRENYPVQITGIANSWMAESGAEALN